MHVGVLSRVAIDDIECFLLFLIDTILILARDRSHKVLTIGRK